MTANQSPLQLVLSRVTGAIELSRDTYKFICPCHDDHSPSATVKITENGDALLICRACNAQAEEITSKIGLKMKDLFANPKAGSKKPSQKLAAKARSEQAKEPEKPDEIPEFANPHTASLAYGYGKPHFFWDYIADGVHVGRVCRWPDPDRLDKKKIKPVSKLPNGRWAMVGMAEPRPVYHLDDLRSNADPAVITEGEKACEAARSIGLNATASANGANSPAKTDWSEVAKRGIALFWRDNDQVGVEFVELTSRILIELNPDITIKVVVTGREGTGDDAADWVESKGEAELHEMCAEVMAMFEAAPPYVPPPASKRKTRDSEDSNLDLSRIKDMDELDLRLRESRSDLGNGKRIIRAHGVNLRHCHQWHKWLVWDDRRWDMDHRAAAELRAKSVADGLWAELRAMGPDISDELQAKIEAFIKTSNSMPCVYRSMQAAASEPGCTVVPGDLDSNPWLLNCANGTVNLQNGELQPHNQADMITKICPVVFNPDATCPTWERFLISIFVTPEMIAYVQRLCGYWATGVIREQSLPILWGVGSNGKGTFLNAIMEALGPDYAIKAPADFLMVKRNDPHPTEKADLFGRRLVVCSETEEGRRLNESMVKELTGNEPIRARRMREDPWQFDPTHKIALVTNHKPQIRGTDHGIWRRIRLIEFGKKFWNPDVGESGPLELMQDKSLEDSLKDELPGILTWIVRGCLEWLHDGEQAPPAVTGSTKDYRESQDILGAFLDECCRPSEYKERASAIYQVYQRWAKANGENPVTQTKFGEAMTERRYVRKKSDGVMYYERIELQFFEP